MLENTEGAVKMDNPDKLSTQGTQHEDEQQKKTKRKPYTICVGHHYTQTNINSVNKI